MELIENLKMLDGVRLNFNENSVFALNLTIAFIMLGVAFELKWEDFKKIFKEPKAVVVGIFSQFLFLPLITFLITIALRNYITPTVGLGMILVAACPGGNISNFISNLARGNTALSVSLTAFSSMAGLFMTPFNFALWGNLFLGIYGQGENAALLPPIEVDPFNVFKTLLIILALPLVIGISLNSRWPETIQKLVPTVKRLSILVFTLILVLIFMSNYEHFINYIIYIFFIVLLHNGTALLTGYYSGKVFGLDKRDCKTLSIETGIQNSGLALALLFNPAVFQQDLPLGGMAFIAAWWGVWHIVAGLTMAGFWTGFSIKSKTVEVN